MWSFKICSAFATAAEYKLQQEILPLEKEGVAGFKHHEIHCVIYQRDIQILDLKK